ncbi:MAG: hypothetical protein ACOYIO_09910 [Eubacteriales bacterium]|jgi:hypothetical protein
MHSYQPLWEWLARRNEETVTLTFSEIAGIAGVPMNHSFLNEKKELTAYGWRVDKISLKAETVTFEKNH